MEINPCLKCGRQPKRRYRAPFNWYECKCGRKGPAVCDFYEPIDAESVNRALVEWNKRNVKEASK